jgi:Ser/Thr protein kinase RdoA (MazF antagonist)
MGRLETMETQRWPVAGALVGMRRPDLWYRNRARTAESMSAAELAPLLRRWGLTPTGPGLRIGSGRSLTLILECAEGTVLVKRYKAGLEEASIASEHAVLQELALRGVPSVRLRSTTNGETIVSDGAERYAVFDALQGYLPLHELVLIPSARKRAIQAAGSTLAQLHEVLAPFNPPARPTTGLAADGSRVLPSSWHLDRLEARAGEGSFTAAADRLRELDPIVTSLDLRRSVIHGDFGPYNLLVRRGQPVVLADFELARRDWRLVDVASALPRFAVSRLGFGRDRAMAFVRGYLDVDPHLAGELPHAPAVLEFLRLRFAGLLLDRHAGDGSEKWLVAARSAVAEAHALQARRHPLALLVDGRGA